MGLPWAAKAINSVVITLPALTKTCSKGTIIVLRGQGMVVASQIRREFSTGCFTGTRALVTYIEILSSLKPY